jgi:hypothetical protein
MRQTGAQVTLRRMCDQVALYFGIVITTSGMSKALAALNICHKEAQQSGIHGIQHCGQNVKVLMGFG